MKVASSCHRSIFRLSKDLLLDAKTFVKQEVRLATVELKEKLSGFAHKMIGLGVGGPLAYVGLFALLIGLGFLVVYLLD